MDFKFRSLKFLMIFLMLNINAEVLIQYFNCWCGTFAYDAISVCKGLVVKLIMSLALLFSICYELKI
jgi:hypothetical protein